MTVIVLRAQVGAPVLTWNMAGDMKAPDEVAITLRSNDRLRPLATHTRQDSGVLESKKVGV